MRSISPIDGRLLGETPDTTAAELAAMIDASASAFAVWRIVPAPRRGELVRLIGEKLRAKKAELADLVTREVGKIRQESLGEVQEMIDMCDFAVGLSRQLYGLTIASERPGHRLMEQWHPLGPVGVITAFNFPVAVWAWNAMLALVCGDPVVWKPSEKAPLCAVACQRIAQEAITEFGDAPPGLLSLAIGDYRIGASLVTSEKVPLISATGSVRMGKAVASLVAGTGHPRHRLRRRRNLRATLHDAATAHHPSLDLQISRRKIDVGFLPTENRQPPRRWHISRPAH
jgi:aldehyde dehydrogenase (NAD+)